MSQPPARNLSMKRELLPVLLLLLVYALAYLPRIDQFGFYKDDWHMIYHGHTYGANTITDSFLVDRPIMGQVNRAAYLLLGDSPLAWNLFAFAARFAGVLALYALVRLVWPKSPFAALVVSLLFAVYPGFLQQPNAATFQNHFIGYSLALVSILLTVTALRTRGWGKDVALIGSALCAAGYLWIYEYMIGVEALRAALLVYLLRRPAASGGSSTEGDNVLAKSHWKPVLWRALLHYLPVLAVVLVFLGWRFFIFSSDRPATNVGLITAGYLAAPLQTLADMASGGFKDILETSWLAWSAPLYLVWQNAGLGELALGLLLAAAAGALVLWSARRIEGDDLPAADAKAAAWIGLLAVLGALFPIVAADRSVYFSDQFDRYTLHASAGVGLLLAGLLFSFFNRRLRSPLLALLVGAAVLTHSLNGAYWAQFWKIQQNFWQQVAWRAPGLADGTLLMARLPQSYGLAEDYEIFSPANLLYHPEDPRLRIYGEILNDSTARNVVNQVPYSYRFIRFFELERDFRKTLIVDWPGGESCAHFIDGSQPELSGASDALLFWTAPYSRIDQIEVDAAAPEPLAVFFGREPDPAASWCYAYQKASLARQRGDWQEVIRLYEEAQANGLAAADPIEWLPFLQAFAVSGDEQRAEELAAWVRADYNTYASFCLLSTQDPALLAEPGFQQLCAPLKSIDQK